MKPSPLTLHDVQFIRVRVEPDLEAKIADAERFTFDGSMLAWSLDYGREEEDDTWWVAVGFATNTAEEGPRCPYILDVQAVGVFSVASQLPQDQHEKLASEYGAALVYGSIREMVSNITARSLSGMLTLPTPSFIGSFEAVDDGV